MPIDPGTAFLRGLKTQNSLFDTAFNVVDEFGERTKNSSLFAPRQARNITALNRQTYDNLYNIAERKQNFTSDLVTSGLNSQFAQREAQRNIDNFDVNTQRDDLQRQNDIKKLEYDLANQDLFNNYDRVVRESKLESITRQNESDKFFQSTGVDLENVSSDQLVFAWRSSSNNPFLKRTLGAKVAETYGQQIELFKDLKGLEDSGIDGTGGTSSDRQYNRLRLNLDPVFLDFITSGEPGGHPKLLSMDESFIPDAALDSLDEYLEGITPPSRKLDSDVDNTTVNPENNNTTRSVTDSDSVREKVGGVQEELELTRDRERQIKTRVASEGIIRSGAEGGGAVSVLLSTPTDELSNITHSEKNLVLDSLDNFKSSLDPNTPDYRSIIEEINIKISELNNLSNSELDVYPSEVNLKGVKEQTNFNLTPPEQEYLKYDTYLPSSQRPSVESVLNDSVTSANYLDVAYGLAKWGEYLESKDTPRDVRQIFEKLRSVFVVWEDQNRDILKVEREIESLLSPTNTNSGGNPQFTQFFTR